MTPVKKAVLAKRAVRLSRACVLLFLLAACGGGPTTVSNAKFVQIDSPMTWWNDHGFVEVTPPAHLPSANASSATVEVWVKAPTAGLTIVNRADGKPVVVWPEGSVAERVEYRGSGTRRRVVDVRGTRIGPENERFDHIYRPDGDGNLVGYEWRADDLDTRDAVTAVMVELTGDDRMARKMNCTSCHVPLRPDNTEPREFGFVNRGTDGSGWFTPSTVLHDSVPLEAYSTDRNALRADLDISCANGDETPVVADGRFACESSVPIARRTTTDPDLCATRAWLASRLTTPVPTRLECP